MKSKFFLRLIICLAVLALPGKLFAAPVDTQEAVVWADNTGRQLLESFRIPDPESRFRQIDRLFVENVDTDYVSRFVIGKYWRQMTPDQKEKYRGIFNRYALSIYKTFPLDFVNSVTYQVTGAQSDSSFTTVSAVVKVRLSPDQPPESFLLFFRLHRQEGKIRLVDIKLAESSLILAYRNKFYEMLAAADNEIEWFLEDLETLTLANETANARRLQNASSL